MSEELDYTKLAASLVTNKTFMKKIKNSIHYTLRDEPLRLTLEELVERIVSESNRDNDDIRAIIIEELPLALNLLFAGE